MGFWQGNTYVRIHTPEVVAYHDNNEQLYLAPNLKMCTVAKDIHFLCLSKPFVRNNTDGICSLESIRPDTSCPAKATPHSQVEVTQAEIIGNRWLVNTPARTATLTNYQHDTATCIILPNQTLWITVPKGSILHIDELALYLTHLQTAFLCPWSGIGRKDQGGRNATYWFDTCWHSFRSYRLPSARWRANYSVLVCRWHSALHLYYCRICCDFDTGLPPTQASELPFKSLSINTSQASRAYSDMINPTKNPRSICFYVLAHWRTGSCGFIFTGRAGPPPYHQAEADHLKELQTLSKP